MLLWFAFRGQNLQDIFDELKSANYSWVFISVLVSIVAHYFRALRWNLLIKPLGYSPSSSNTFHAVMIGYLANLAVPRMGEVSRCGILNRTDKVPLNSLIGTVIIERIIDVVFMLGILAFSIFIQYQEIFEFIKVNILSGFLKKIPNTSSILILLGVLIIFGLLFFQVLKKYHQSFLKFKFYQKIMNLLIGFKEGILSVIKMDKKGLFIFYSFMIWLLYILSTYFCYFAISATSNLSFVSAIFIMAVGGIGMSAPVQGGIGAFEASVQMGLLVYGIEASNGLSYATLSHGAQILSILLVGSISLIYIFVKYRKNAHVS